MGYSNAMRLHVTYIVAVLVFCAAFDRAHAQSSGQRDKIIQQEMNRVTEQHTPKLIAIDASMDAGYRWDDLQWNKAGPDSNPDVLSELTWRNMRSYTLSSRAEILFNDLFLIDLGGGYGWVDKGENQDSDYLTSGRRDEFSRSNNASNIGHVLDLSAALGLRFSVYSSKPDQAKEFFDLDNFYYDILAGYSYNEQQFYMTEGNQTVPATGPFGGLKSNYEAQWRSPWIGLQAHAQKNGLLGFARFEYHQAQYHGQANWNLRSDFMHPDSYEHRADGYGLVFIGGVSYFINPRWSVDAIGKHNRWSTKPGKDTIFFSDGSTYQDRLNRVDWVSTSFSLGSTFHF